MTAGQSIDLPRRNDSVFLHYIFYVFPSLSARLVQD